MTARGRRSLRHQTIGNNHIIGESTSLRPDWGLRELGGVEGSGRELICVQPRSNALKRSQMRSNVLQIAQMTSSFRHLPRPILQLQTNCSESDAMKRETATRRGNHADIIPRRRRASQTIWRLFTWQVPA
jgi:hypothetical protein